MAVRASENFASPVAHEPLQAHMWRWFDPILIGLLWIVLLIGGVVALVASFAVIQGSAFEIDALLLTLPFNIGVLTIQAVTLFLAVQAGLLWRRKRWAEIGLGSLSRRWALIAVGTAVALRVLVVPLGLLYQAIDPNVTNPQLDFLLPGGQISIPGMIGMFVITGVAIPIVEEAFFRGVLYTFLQRWGVILATVLSALLFAVAHLNLLIGLNALLLGLACAVVYERSKSLTAAVIVHIVFNTLGVAMLYGAVAAGIQF